MTIDGYVDSSDNTKGDVISHYDSLGKLNVTKVAYGCYYEYGTTAYAEATVGKIVAKEGGEISVLYATAATVAAKEDGGTIGTAYCEGTASTYDSFSTDNGGNVTFDGTKTLDEIKSEGANAVTAQENEEFEEKHESDGKTYVARVGTKPYDTFEAAVEAAQDNAVTIVLMDDVDLSGYTGENTWDRYDIDLTDDILDLNGYTITSSHAYGNVAVTYIGSNFTIKNGTFELVNGYNASYAIYLGNGFGDGTENVVLENVTSNNGINCYRSSVTMNNVTSTGTNYYSVWAEKDSQITINSGSYSTNGVSVFNTDNGVECWIKVNGGTITANGSSIIAMNTVSFAADSAAVCNKNPGDDFVEKPYGFVEENGTWIVSKTYQWKVSYENVGYFKYDSWSDVTTAATADSSKVFINLSFYKSANSTCTNAYTPLSDTDTKVGFNCTAPQVYGYGTGFFGGESEALKCFFKYENSTITEYFKTEADADAFVAQHSGAVKTAISD